MVQFADGRTRGSQGHAEEGSSLRPIALHHSPSLPQRLHQRGLQPQCLCQFHHQARSARACGASCGGGAVSHVYEAAVATTRKEQRSASDV